MGKTVHNPNQQIRPHDTRASLGYKLASLASPARPGHERRLRLCGWLGRTVGPWMVAGVVALTIFVVGCMHVYVLPAYLRTHGVWPWLAHLAFGHYLLLNIVFNYFMAATTHPGRPSRGVAGAVRTRGHEQVTCCKKCSALRPPRAHHCSICKSCVLKMDHHCPLLNNCVGFYNHRYFMLYLMFIWIGTIYVQFMNYDLFHEMVFGDKELPFSNIFFPGNWFYFRQTMDQEDKIRLLKVKIKDKTGFTAVFMNQIICFAASVGLLSLGTWNAYLVSRGMTLIEWLQAVERRALGMEQGGSYRHPYNLGFWGNWRELLGGGGGRSLWRHVLLPSLHQPHGRGDAFPTYHDFERPSEILCL